MTDIYHITHIRNLPSIIEDGCLWSDAKIRERDIDTTNIAYSHIKERRMRKAVPVAAGGFLGEYVPFHFCPRTPMLYTINKGNVEDYQGGQSQIVHLVSNVETAANIGKPWAFTDIHAVLGYAGYYDDWDSRIEIDWEVISSNNWAGGERTEKKHAEFLVHESFPWSGFHTIGVCNTSILEEVKNILEEGCPRPLVQVKSSWYY